jgi:hypothetical protein
VAAPTLSPPQIEWFEVLVTSIEGETFTVRFCDWPAEPPFNRSREQLALMHPTREPLPPLEPLPPAEAA